MSETKAAFAELTIRFLKTILYRYMEDYGYKYIHKLPQFVATMTFRSNRSIDMKANRVRNSDFMSILYSKPLRENKKSEFTIGDLVGIPKYDLPFRKGYKPQFNWKFLKLLPLLLKNLQHTLSKTKKKFLVENFTRRK